MKYTYIGSHSTTISSYSTGSPADSQTVDSIVSSSSPDHSFKFSLIWWEFEGIPRYLGCYLHTSFFFFLKKNLYSPKLAFFLSSYYPGNRNKIILRGVIVFFLGYQVGTWQFVVKLCDGGLWVLIKDCVEKLRLFSEKGI